MNNVSRLAVVVFAVAVMASHADETKLAFTVDGITYSNVTFSTVTPTTVKIFHSSGVEKLPLAKLPLEIRRQLGFDPEKLRNLAPPPNPGIKENAGPPSLDERMKRVEEIILKPLALTAAQKETANKAFRDFYVEMDKLGKAQPGATTPPDRSRMEPLEKARDAKIKQVISAAQYAKYLDLEKAARPPRPEGKSPGQK